MGNLTCYLEETLDFLLFSFVSLFHEFARHLSTRSVQFPYILAEYVLKWRWTFCLCGVATRPVLIFLVIISRVQTCIIRCDVRPPPGTIGEQILSLVEFLIRPFFFSDGLTFSRSNVQYLACCLFVATDKNWAMILLLVELVE